MAQPLVEWIEQFCTYQFKQKGKTESGVRTYRWNLEQFLRFVRKREGRLARVVDVNAEAIQAWMDDMAESDLAVSTMRVRQSALSSLCTWMVKRNALPANPVAKLDRPPHRKEPPRQVPVAGVLAGAGAGQASLLDWCRGCRASLAKLKSSRPWIDACVGC